MVLSVEAVRPHVKQSPKANIFIHRNSPLRAHLESGNIIYALDDTQLSMPNPSGHDTWEEFLLADDSLDRPLQKVGVYKKIGIEVCLLQFLMLYHET